jgi:hypothetical protein
MEFTRIGFHEHFSPGEDDDKVSWVPEILFKKSNPFIWFFSGVSIHKVKLQTKKRQQQLFCKN